MTDKEFRENCPPTVRNFLRYHSYAKGHSEKTLAAYCRDLHRFFIWLHQNDGLPENAFDLETAKAIRKADIYEYILYMGEKEKLSAKTQKRSLSAIKSFFHYLSAVEGSIEPMGIELVEPPKERKYTSFDPKILEAEDIRDLQNLSCGRNDIRDHLIISLFLNTGMRLSELSGLELSSVNPKTGEIRVLGKGNKLRTVFLCADVLRELQEYLLFRQTMKPQPGQENALFLSERGTRLSGRRIEDMIKKRCLEAKLDSTQLHAHSLRHSTATMLIRSGTDIETVSRILGHSSTAITSLYLHSNEELQKEASEKLSGLLT